MANIENLDPVRTTEEARKRGRNGGKKSAENKKKRRMAKECMNMILSMDATGKNGKKMMSQMGIDDKDQQNIMLLMATMFAKASSSGDAGTIKAILEIAGDTRFEDEQKSMPTIKINVQPATEKDIENLE